MPSSIASAFAERQPIYAMYLNDNWRAFRTWGVSAISPWSHGQYWVLRDGVDKSRKEFTIASTRYPLIDTLVYDRITARYNITEMLTVA